MICSFVKSNNNLPFDYKSNIGFSATGIFKDATDRKMINPRNSEILRGAGISHVTVIEDLQ